MPDKNKIAYWHKHGLWAEAMVRNAVVKGVLTEAAAVEILKDDK